MTFPEFIHFSSLRNTEPEECEFLVAASKRYGEIQVIDSKDDKTFLYANDTSNTLQFIYVRGGRTDNLFEKAELYTLVDRSMRYVNTDIFSALSEKEADEIIWQDSETETLYV